MNENKINKIIPRILIILIVVFLLIIIIGLTDFTRTIQYKKPPVFALHIDGYVDENIGGALFDIDVYQGLGYRIEVVKNKGIELIVTCEFYLLGKYYTSSMV